MVDLADLAPALPANPAYSYALTADVDAKIAAQAATDSATYLSIAPGAGLTEGATKAELDAEVTTARAAEAARQPLDSDLTAIAGLDSSVAGALATDGAGWLRKTYAQVKTALALTKSDVGLANVDNTSDADKPVSAAQADAFVALANEQIFIRPSDFNIQTGAPSLTGGAGSGSLPGWLLDSATTEHVTSSLLIPPGWATVACDLWWCNQGAGAGDVRWRTSFFRTPVGSSAQTQIADVSFTATADAPNVITKTAVIPGGAVNAFDLLRLSILRAGGDVADTLPNDVGMLGILVRRLT